MSSTALDSGGDRYEAKLDDLLTIQQEIASGVSRALEPDLTPDQQSGLAKRYTENVEAYRLYLKGRFFSSKRTPDSLKKAIQHFEEAIRSRSRLRTCPRGTRRRVQRARQLLSVSPSRMPPEGRRRRRAGPSRSTRACPRRTRPSRASSSAITSTLARRGDALQAGHPARPELRAGHACGTPMA